MKTQNTSAPAMPLSNMFIVIAIFFSSITLLTSCQKDESLDLAASQSNASSDQSFAATAKGDGLDDIIIAMKRGDNDLGLPVYSFEAHSNGVVIYNGFSNVRVEGTVEFTVEEWLVPALAEHAASLGFFEMDDEYPPRSKEVIQVAVTSLQMANRSKSITEYGVDLPAELIEIQQTIEGKLGITRFTRGE